MFTDKFKMPKSYFECKKYSLSNFIWNFTRPIRRLIDSVENLVIWFPIIWKDRQWDYSFLLEIMIKKLQLMEDYFNRPNPLIEESGVIANEIKEARNALIYINNEKYVSETLDGDFSNYYKQKEKKYNKAMNTFCNSMKKNIRKWWD